MKTLKGKHCKRPYNLSTLERTDCQSSTKARELLLICANENYFLNEGSNDCEKCPVERKCWHLWEIYGANIQSDNCKYTIDEFAERFKEIKKEKKQSDYPGV